MNFAPDAIQTWPLSRLQPYARTTRRHGADQIAKIAASTAEFGWTVPYRVAEDFDLSLVGFSDGELDKLLAFVPEGESEEGGAGGSVPPVTIPEPPRNPASRTGYLWLLGDHRLLSGDSTNPADVRRQMNGKRAVLFATETICAITREESFAETGNMVHPHYPHSDSFDRVKHRVSSLVGSSLRRSCVCTGTTIGSPSCASSVNLRRADVPRSLARRVPCAGSPRKLLPPAIGAG